MSDSMVRNTVLIPARSSSWMVSITSMRSFPPWFHVTSAPRAGHHGELGRLVGAPLLLASPPQRVAR